MTSHVNGIIIACSVSTSIEVAIRYATVNDTTPYVLLCFLFTDYVCVMELDWFQMTLRLCNNAEGDSDYQKVTQL